MLDPAIRDLASKGANFGKPTVEGNFQTTRTFRFSVGVRF